MKCKKCGEEFDGKDAKDGKCPKCIKDPTRMKSIGIGAVVNNMKFKENNITKCVDKLSEGWGAETQKKDLERHRQEIADLIAKYPEKKKEIEELKLKNYNANGIKQKLKLG